MREPDVGVRGDDPRAGRVELGREPAQQDVQLVDPGVPRLREPPEDHVDARVDRAHLRDQVAHPPGHLAGRAAQERQVVHPEHLDQHVGPVGGHEVPDRGVGGVVELQRRAPARCVVAVERRVDVRDGPGTCRHVVPQVLARADEVDARTGVDEVAPEPVAPRPVTRRALGDRVPHHQHPQRVSALTALTALGGRRDRDCDGEQDSRQRSREAGRHHAPRPCSPSHLGSLGRRRAPHRRTAQVHAPTPRRRTPASRAAA